MKKMIDEVFLQKIKLTILISSIADLNPHVSKKAEITFFEDLFKYYRVYHKS